MAQLLQKVEKKGEEMDAKHSQDIDDVDLSGIDLTAKRPTVKCVRCEKDIDAEFIKEHMNSHSSEILPWLFLGGYRNADNEVELTKRTRISHLLNLAHECNMRETCREEIDKFWQIEGYSKDYFTYKKIDWTDTADQDIKPLLGEAVEFVKQAHDADANHHVLVHCVQGISRSSSVVIAYLVLHEGMTLKDAYDKVKAARSTIDPRPNFLDALGEFECRKTGASKPTLTSGEIWDGRQTLFVG